MGKLISFGIPVDRFPFDDDTSIKLRTHTRFLARQRVLDRMVLSGTFDQWCGSHIPGTKDILIGTGAHIPEHSGNRWLVSILEQYFGEYNGAISAGKHKIETIKKVVAHVEGEGGRFLKQWENLWCQTDHPSDKNEKVIHCFRGMNKRVCVTRQKQHLLPIVDPYQGEENEEENRQNGIHVGSGGIGCIGCTKSKTTTQTVRTTDADSTNKRPRIVL